MISRIHPWLLSVLVCWLSGLDAREPVATALDGVHVIDTERGRVNGARCVRIKGDMIVAVTKAGSRRCLRDARVLELAGRYVLPGLIDMHAHLTL
ncbi:MAG: hypothetical protein ACNA7J_11320, partial [Wenzhouxiangella sp.]